MKDYTVDEGKKSRISSRVLMAEESRVSSADGLLAVIADEETVTGFLLAGVGDIAPNKKKNYMTVTTSTFFGVFHRFSS